ncbi:hypothetical protein BKK52_11410 [Rodentibacter trehalosifermentans]|uniref:Uncharacterized protein n=1 Tax=Rodentibacter trehalosifermentans TaxID=1908263 RepID=A0A1V3IW67_9PAST|nr:hypothetical protein [Rodentibacter trehalosifermentans]OOF46527.1 hypothetical protein BKK52_11410 [Rodentibacter trehalosifermentans]
MNLNEQQAINTLRLLFCATNDDFVKALILRIGEESEHQIINHLSNSCWGDDIQNFYDIDSVRSTLIKEFDFVIDKRQQKRIKNRTLKRAKKFTKWYSTEGKSLIQAIPDDNDDEFLKMIEQDILSIENNEPIK